MMRTSNPALRPESFQNLDRLMDGGLAQPSSVMTVKGAATKTMILLLLALGTAAWSWNIAATGGAQAAFPYMIGGVIGGLVFALITIFVKKASPVTAPLYALCEGLFLGSVSALFEAQYQGIVIGAVSLTFGTLFCLLIAYMTGIVRATAGFKMGVVAATVAICLFYIVTMIMRLFGVDTSVVTGNGLLGIGINAVIVVVAALNLVLDFDLIEQGAATGAPKYMEWYSGFALLVTLVWLYLEILRLLSKLRSR